MRRPTRVGLGAPLFLSLLAAGPAPAQAGARISGTVFDSTTGRVLTGAVVQLAFRQDPARARSVTSDSQGRWAFDSVDAGSWLVGFYHDAVDALGLDVKPAVVDVRDRREVRVMLSIPSRTTIASLACPDAALAGRRGIWIGTVRSAVDGGSAPGALVSVEWMELKVSGSTISRDAKGATAVAGEGGMFAICGIPTDETLFARAAAGPDSSGAVSFFTAADGFVSQSLFVGPTRVDTVATDSAGVVVVALSGTGSLRGRVTGRNGRPLAGARVVFWGREGEGASNSEGRYSLAGLPLGTHTVEVRALGQVPVRRPVHVMAGIAVVEDFALESRETYLDTVRVVGQRVFQSVRYREFLDRKGRGFGHFVDEEEIGRRHAMFVSDLVRTVPGVQVFPGSMGGQVLMRSSGFRGWCSPALFIDGVRIHDGASSLEVLLTPNDIRGVEVYTRGAGMPMQFQTLEGCGSIVVWTGPRRVRPEDPERRRKP